MHREPSGRIFSNALQFYSLAKPALENSNKLQENIMAVICNLALCVELLLKCSDSGVKVSPSQSGGPLGDAEIYSNAWGHDLEKIFNALDPSISRKLEILFKKETTADLKPLLKTCKDYFIHARYAHEPESGHCYEVTSIQNLAEGLIASIKNWRSA